MRSSPRLNGWRLTNTFSKALLNLHRPYFAAAIRDRSIDPGQHKYGPSVLAIYRAANRIIEAGSKAVGAIPQSCMAMITYSPRYHSWFDHTPPIAVFRFSFGWSKVLSSAVCHLLRISSWSTSAVTLYVIPRSSPESHHQTPIALRSHYFICRS